ncbi:MAG: signal peptidase I [Anaerolineae bacterium]|nr:signal peptidase I [Anaerolineae bacterium]
MSTLLSVSIHDQPMLAFRYQGLSMHGTFREGEMLYVVPVPLESARVGDVVAFYRHNARGEVTAIAHRVRARTQSGQEQVLVTQGDASTAPDVELVDAAHFIGCVRFAQRGSRLYDVRNGAAGQLWAEALRLGWRVARWGRAPYRWLRASGVLRRWVHLKLTQVHLNTGRGPLVKILHGGRTAAYWWVNERRLCCYKPYDLFLAPPVESLACEAEH